MYRDSYELNLTVVQKTLRRFMKYTTHNRHYRRSMAILPEERGRTIPYI